MGPTKCMVSPSECVKNFDAPTGSSEGQGLLSGSSVSPHEATHVPHRNAAEEVAASLNGGGSALQPPGTRNGHRQTLQTAFRRRLQARASTRGTSLPRGGDVAAILLHGEG
jgi:hypothetical protein